MCHGFARDVSPSRVPGDRAEPWYRRQAQRWGRGTEPWGQWEPFTGARSGGTAGDVAAPGGSLRRFPFSTVGAWGSACPAQGHTLSQGQTKNRVGRPDSRPACEATGSTSPGKGNPAPLAPPSLCQPLPTPQSEGEDPGARVAALVQWSWPPPELGAATTAGSVPCCCHQPQGREICPSAGREWVPFTTGPSLGPLRRIPCPRRARSPPTALGACRDAVLRGWENLGGRCAGKSQTTQPHSDCSSPCTRLCTPHPLPHTPARASDCKRAQLPPAPRLPRTPHGRPSVPRQLPANPPSSSRLSRSVFPQRLH